MDATLTKDATVLTGFTREAVEELSRRKNEPDWVREARLAAWETYEQLPMPSRTDEEWRRTDLRRLKLDRIAPFAGPEQERVSALDGLLASVEDGGVSNESARAGVIVQ
ncbi:MAG TPA: Fe-S cluster assembly protein SufD, partial [Thermomicrobiales bacterium]|nr:Fe-S cluster assembly protein SufD [Thermomicrobiales bacterium]